MIFHELFRAGSAFAGISSISLLIDDDHKYYESDNFSLPNKSKVQLIQSLSNDSKLIIPRFIEIIYSNCFSYCQSLDSITFESRSSLKAIESFAFLKSSIQSVILPGSVEVLCSNCFSNCRSLESVIFESPSSLKVIASDAFYNSLDSIFE
jgi:hypothetical protein